MKELSIEYVIIKAESIEVSYTVSGLSSFHTSNITFDDNTDLKKPTKDFVKILEEQLKKNYIKKELLK